MSEFVPGRAQDASSTVRGFKYQIQLTLRRWLDLGQGEVLYLECGEDIDHVLGEGDLGVALRELEQVKARGRNVTLRSPEVLTAFANFSSHLKANPGLPLRFRFTTTAFAGREKLSPFPRGANGIDVWRLLQKKTRWTTLDDGLFSQIAEVVRNSPRPTECAREAWDEFMAIVNGTGSLMFAEFLSRFEWSCGSESPEDLRTELLNKLGGLAGDTGPDDAAREQRYEQLTAAVLELLSQKGEKKLTPELLATTLAKPTLGDQDRARLRILEERTASQEGMLASIQEQLGRLTTTSALPVVFGRAAAEKIDAFFHLPDLPPLVAALATRTETVDSVSGRVALSKWLNIHGDFGIGKSHLAFLVAGRNGGVLLGVSTRGMNADAASHGLRALAENPVLIALLESRSAGIVLLDDLPDVPAQSSLEFALAYFVKLVRGNMRTVISTSRRTLPTSLAEIFKADLEQIQSPPFSDSDADELFRAHSLAKRILTTQRVSALNAMCGGHPMLLTALARYVQNRPDEPDQAIRDALFGAKHRTDVDLETYRAMLNTVEEPSCRNLLYRLAATGIALGTDEIRTVANVKPALPEPSACVARLDGLWLRRVAGIRFEVSPLTAPFARELPNDLKIDVHREVAAIVLRRGHVTPWEFYVAIQSLLLAGEQNLAAVHLIHGCFTWPNRAAGYSQLGILEFFPLARKNKLHPFNEIPLRAAQAVSIAALEGEFLPHAQRIESLTATSTPDIARSSMLAASLILISSLEKTPMKLSLLAASLVEKFRDSPVFSSEEQPLGKGRTEYFHFILPMATARNWDDVDGFVEFLGAVPEPRRTAFMLLPEAREGIQLLFFRSLFDFDGAITNDAYRRLDLIEEQCAALGLDTLAAYAATGKLIILGEDKKDVEGMLSEGSRARCRFSNNAVAVSVIDASIGKQLYLNRRPAEGLEALAAGLNDPTLIVGAERATYLVDALSAAWDADVDPVPYADQLAELLSMGALKSPEPLCQMHAQVALVRWRQGRRAEAFTHLETAVVNFLKLEDNTRAHQLGAALAHVLHFDIAVAETGQPPPMGSDGGPYVEGLPRMFSGVNRGMAGFWKARQGPAMLRWSLGRLASDLGLDEIGFSWADRALDAAIEVRSPVLLMMLMPRAVAAALRSKKWADAIEASLIQGRARLFLEDAKDNVSKLLDDSAHFNPLDAPPDGVRAQQAEAHALWIFSRALVIELAQIVLERSQDDSEAVLNLSKIVENVHSSSSLPEAWIAMADVIRLSVSEHISDKEHRDTLQNRDFASVVFVAHGILGLRSDVRFEQAAVSQASTLRSLSSDERAIGISIEPYVNAVIKYWTQAVDRAKFRFRAPAELSKAIASAPVLPRMLTAKFILRAVLSNLGTRVADETKSWLSTPPTSPTAES